MPVLQGRDRRETFAPGPDTPNRRLGDERADEREAGMQCATDGVLASPASAGTTHAPGSRQSIRQC
jgi:hypothetical protein